MRLPGRSGSKRLLVAVVVTIAPVAAGIGLYVLRGWNKTPSIAETVNAAQRELALGHRQRAEELALQALRVAPDSLDALLIAAQAAERQGRLRVAVAYCDRVPISAGRRAAAAYVAAGKICLYKLFQPWQAEIRFRRALTCDPKHLGANQEMINVLSLNGRQREIVPHVLELLRQGECLVTQLVLLAAPEGSFGFPELLGEFRRGSPTDPIVLLAAAQEARREGKRSEAERLAQKALHEAPEFLAAHWHLGRLYVESAHRAAFLKWHAQLPANADNHPETWTIRALWARKQNDLRVAARCYWEAVRRDPSQSEANYQLSQILTVLGEQERAQGFLARADELHKLKDTESTLLRLDRSSLSTIHTTAGRLVSLGRIWEAWGWCGIALRIDPRLSWAKAMAVQLGETLLHNPPLTLNEANPAMQVSLVDLPLPRWTSHDSRPSAAGHAHEAVSQVRFSDLAASAGLDFRYYNAGEPEQVGLKKMYETTGGGVAVLDYDCDGWPDIYLTQGCRWPAEEQQKQHLDRLYRNLGNGRFEDVTLCAGVIEARFSQGAAVGDYDNDGFPDLYVANVGRNRLYHNDGDGTFTDVTETTGTDGDQWTTSCLIADLNADSFPDVLAVNYLAGEDVYTRMCRGDTGKYYSCAPHDFEASQDRLYGNGGDGTFHDVTSESGIEVPGGKGLGVVAADTDNSGRLSVFVTVDALANLFFENQTSPGSAVPLFVEKGLRIGVALNQAGRHEAGMGIAVGDADQDGLLDFFVTNFWNETNTLYLQQHSSMFRDATDESGLGRLSLRSLAWGTQFIDGELDGRLDLIVTNGHVDDHRDTGQDYQMPAQYFRNLGAAQFVEIDADTLGPFFDGRRLGRGLARMDYNRDGLEDVVISHLDAPVALLANTTAEHGHFVSVRLRAVDSARDAIGTVVRVVAAGRTLVRQLTAGDGFHASNQKILVFGLAQNNRIEELRIRWPSGRRQTFSDLPADIELLFIEGRAECVRCGRP